MFVLALTGMAFAGDPLTMGAADDASLSPLRELAPTWVGRLHVRDPGVERIVNGSTTNDFEQVVAVGADFGNQGQAVFCSGTLIADKWVITAAHCVRAYDEDYSGSTPFVAFGGDLYAGEVDDLISGVDYAEYPQYDDQQLTGDIGIIELSRANRIGVAPMGVNVDNPSGWNDNGSVRLTYVGFGITRDNAYDDPVKRYTDLAYEGYDTWRIYGYDPNTNVCSGDSGGAVLDERSNGWVLAGVNSFVYSDNRDPTPNTPCVGGGTGGTRIDKALTWIEGYTPTTHGPNPDTSDTDTDTDSDTDTDTDTDTDSDADSDVDTGEGPYDADDEFDDPQVPGPDTYKHGFCATASLQDLQGSVGGLAFAAAVFLRRRRKS